MSAPTAIETDEIAGQMREMGQRARAALHDLGSAGTERKNTALRGAAMALKSAPIPNDRLLESLLLQAWHFVRVGDRSAMLQLLDSTKANHPEHSAVLELSAARWQMQDGVFDGANERLAELPGSTEQAGLLLWSHIQNACLLYTSPSPRD